MSCARAAIAMRSSPVLALCSLLASILPACGDTAAIVEPAPPPAASTPVDETEPPSTTTPEKPATTDSILLDLGEVQVGTDVAFDVPEGALGFNITAEGTADDFNEQQPFGIERITDPSGKIVHDGFMPSGGSHMTSYASFDVIASASVPQGEILGPSLAGTWKVRFGVVDSPSSTMKLRGRVRVQSSGDGAFHGGQLDLHVHVPQGLQIGANTVDAAKASGNPDIKERLDVFFDMTKELLGIERGEVVFHAAPASYQQLDGLNEVVSGFAVSKGQKDGTPGLHVLLTNLIAKDGQPFAAGIAPGIPGAASVFGRKVSGIIVMTSEYPEQDALTMLHEAGHFFGLNHTTEMDGMSFDPLSDTPACSDISMENFMDCPDRSNIMFAAGAIEGPPTLSGKQKRVYRGSPIYRALPAGSSSSMSLSLGPSRPFAKRAFRISGSNVLSPVERELSLGFCGLTGLNAQGLVKRHGRAPAIAQLEAATNDQDLAPYIRGRARLSLTALRAK